MVWALSGPPKNVHSLSAPKPNTNSCTIIYTQVSLEEAINQETTGIPTCWENGRWTVRTHINRTLASNADEVQEPYSISFPYQIGGSLMRWVATLGVKRQSGVNRHHLVYTTLGDTYTNQWVVNFTSWLQLLGTVSEI